MQLVEASGNYLTRWDVFIDKSINGTIFHKRKFLSYHGTRFKDKERYLVALDGNTLFAQITLVVEKDKDGLVAKSPYGASYGGFVFQKQPSYRKGHELMSAFVEYLTSNKINRCVITHPIACCCEYSLDTFYFNLLETGFKSINRDISSVAIYKQNNPIMNLVDSKVRNQARKAEKSGVKVVKNALIDDFWQVMDSTFSKFGKTPTHSIDEFKLLNSLFPDQIYVDVAYLNDNPIAGLAYFVINQRVNSSFYLCQKTEYQHLQGLTLLVMHALERCQSEGFLYFDFGTSSVNMISRTNIFSFKEQYSKSGLFRETFEWKLQI